MPCVSQGTFDPNHIMVEYSGEEWASTGTSGEDMSGSQESCCGYSEVERSTCCGSQKQKCTRIQVVVGENSKTLNQSINEEDVIEILGYVSTFIDMFPPRKSGEILAEHSNK